MPNRQKEIDRPKQLNALTSLRFFAAVMIVVHHTKGSFGLDAQWLLDLPTGQAVSFFFVLSGFILTYVYRSLDSPGATGRFLITRLGRIWPLHLVTLLLVFLLFSAPLRTPGGKDVPSILLANIFLIHGWIPIWEYYFSYNWLSWAISTEVAFYLLFPFLLRKWKSTWHIKLLMSLLLAIATICFVNLFHIPFGNVAENTKKVGYLGLLYISPFGRLFEFSMGMAMAAVYRKSTPFYVLKKPWGTLLEGIAIGMAAGVFFSTQNIIFIINRFFPWLGEGAFHWLAAGGLPCTFFGFLILIMSFEKGLFSTRLLSGRLLSRLGEMSLAVFLLHQILLRYYQAYLEEAHSMPYWLLYTYYWTLLLLTSYILMEWIEKPCRNLFNKWTKATGPYLGKSQVHRSSRRPGERFSLSGLKEKRGTLVALLLFCLLVLPLVVYMHRPAIPTNAIDPEEAKSLADQTHSENRDIVFGKKFILRGAIIRNHPDKILLKLVWQSMQEETLRYFVAVHVLDQNGKILSQADYPQSERDIRVKGGTLWMEETNIPKDKLHSAAALGILIYSINPVAPLRIEAGTKEWPGNRLLIELPKHDTQETSF